MISRRIQFTVVGHPNKGKSSIVSTLARDDAVATSPRSGTTRRATRYRVDTGKGGFELIDTPGFQRPRQVLKWLESHATSAAERKQAVALFVADAECQARFVDEVELLRPLTKCAAVLYVVDGSRPYGREYEAEMEILRWTGCASMALINPILGEAFITDWRNALQQYFKLVRVFNPFQADFAKQRALLEAFTHLCPAWTANIRQVIDDLDAAQIEQDQRCIRLLAHLLSDLCNYQWRQKTLSERQAKALQPVVRKAYVEWMVKREETAFEQLKQIFAHRQTQLSIKAIDYPPDLFDTAHWYAWGLNKSQLIAVSAASGATAGAALDLAVAGHSFMLGAIGGGLLGAGSAVFGADKLLKAKIKGLPLGGFEACQGPVKDKNFPFVVAGRFLHLWRQLRAKNHANRSSLEVASRGLQDNLVSLEAAKKKQLTRAFAKLSGQKTAEDLEEALAPLFAATRLEKKADSKA